MLAKSTLGEDFLWDTLWIEVNNCVIFFVTSLSLDDAPLQLFASRYEIMENVTRIKNRSYPHTTKAAFRVLCLCMSIPSNFKLEEHLITLVFVWRQVKKSSFKKLAWPQFWYLITLHQSLWELFGPGPAMLTAATARKLSLRHSWGFWDCKLHGILSQVILLPSEKDYICMYIYIFVDIGDRLQYGKKWESEIISLLAFFASCLKIVFRNNIYLSYACGGWEFAEGCLFLLMTVKAQVLHHDPFVTKVTHKFAIFNGFFWTPTSSQDTSTMLPIGWTSSISGLDSVGSSEGNAPHEATRTVVFLMPTKSSQ